MSDWYIEDDSLTERYRRAVVACLRATYAWSARKQEPEAMIEVCRMTGILMEALGPGRGPVEPLDLIRCLTKPLSGLLSSLAVSDQLISDAILLDSEGRMTDAAFDVAAEYAVPLGRDTETAAWLPTWTHMRSEEIEAATFTAMVANRDQAEYVRSRRFLIEYPAGSRESVMTTASEQNVRLAAAYGELPSDRTHHTADGRSWWWACAACRWPLRVFGLMARCSYEPHMALYDIVPGTSRNAKPKLRKVDEGRARKPETQNALDACCVDAGVWRHIVVPGSTELRIIDRLAKIEGVRVESWPELDSYDLRVETGKETLRLDVKEYRSATNLLRRLREKPPRAIVLLPQQNAYQVSMIKAALPDIRVMTEKQLLARVHEAARRSSWLS